MANLKAYTLSPAEKMHRWWRPNAGRAALVRMADAAGLAVSIVFHATALFALTTLTLLMPAPPPFAGRPIEVDLQPVSEIDRADQEYRISDEPQQSVGALSRGGIGDPSPQGRVEAEEARIDPVMPPTADSLSTASPTAISSSLQVQQPVLAAPHVTENLIIKGSGSVGTVGAIGAVDRITKEILASLEERPTLVVWLFDQSGSLKPQRDAIAKRFDHIYEELGVIDAQGNRALHHDQEKPLLTTVAEFGQTIQLVTPKPTDNVQEIKASMDAIADDTSGRENTFQSIYFLADKFRHYRLQSPRRNVMIVVFTDEAGDDVDQLDAAVDICRKYEMPVYVVGVPAPFGREEAYIKYVDPDPNFDQTPQWLPLHQGPESLMPERIKLGFAGSTEHDDPIDSGFGPYGLCRLTTETGGIYFTVHPDRKVGEQVSSNDTSPYATHLAAFFDEKIMRNYRPDYLSADQYKQLLAQNRAYAALVEAAQLTWMAPMQDVRRVFPKVDDAQFARELSTAQRSAAKIEPQIEQLLTVLRKGEPDRPKAMSPRWQAGFDLAIGRALAVEVRTEGYNAILAEAKQGMKFKDDKSDTWVLRPAKEVTINSALTKDGADARKYLERVVADHPGTPWALEAKQELKEPLGWEWREKFTDVAGRRARAEAQGKRPQQPEPSAQPQKPHREPPAL
jgi:von Willebrand factor type A domain